MPQLDDILRTAFQDGIKKRLEEIAAEHRRNAIEEMDKQLAEQIASTTIFLMQRVSMEWSGSELRIIVEKRVHDAS